MKKASLVPGPWRLISCKRDWGMASSHSFTRVFTGPGTSLSAKAFFPQGPEYSNSSHTSTRTAVPHTPSPACCESAEQNGGAFLCRVLLLDAECGATLPVWRAGESFTLLQILRLTSRWHRRRGHARSPKVCLPVHSADAAICHPVHSADAAGCCANMPRDLVLRPNTAPAGRERDSSLPPVVRNDRLEARTQS